MNTIILQAAAQAPQAQPNFLISFLPFIGIIAIFYFLIIRPQKKKQKEHEELITSLTKNSKVITNSGILGTIVNVKKETFVVRIDETNNTRIEIQKSAIAGVVENDKNKGKKASS